LLHRNVEARLGYFMNLRLLQLGDSALPVGGYCHSWGLEAAISRGLVGDPASLERWTRNWLKHGVGPLEGVVVGASCRAAANEDWDTVIEANALVRVSLTPPTLRDASRDMGSQLALLSAPWPWANRAVEALSRRPVGEWHHAPVFGALAAVAGATPLEAVSVYLHQAALGVIGAGVRAVPIGHTHGQQVLARLHNDIGSLAAEVADRPLALAGSFSPAYEVLCHAQTGLYTRLFRS
jgi:urease accessory protein